MSFVANENDAQRHLARAREFYLVRRYDLAITAALDACAASPDDCSTFVILANSHERLGHIAEAEAAAMRAIALGPHSARAQTALGMVRLLQRRYPEALKCFREGIRLAPEYADGYRLAAHAEMAQMHYTSALQYVDRALELEPEAIHALEVRAMVLQKAGRTAEAERAVAEVLEHDPESVVGLRHEGLLLLERGNRGDALSAFREALRLDPNSPHVRAGYERVILRTSFAKHIRAITIVLFAIVWVTSFIAAQRVDFVSFFEAYVAIGLIRRTIIVEALRRDEISRTFLEPGAISANPLSALLATGSLVAAALAGVLEDHALTLFGAGLLLATVALRGTGLTETTKRGRLAFHAAAVFFIALAGFEALAVDLGGSVALLPAISLASAVRTTFLACALVVALVATRQKAAFVALIRSLYPPRRR